MNALTYLQALLLRSLLTAFVLASPVANAQSLQTNAPGVAQALVQAGVPLSAVGAYVQEIGDARPLIAHNAQAPMNPASVMKLVTTYAALDLLGPAYTWRTEAYASRPLAGEVLDGDLILKGYGDPKLNIEQFWLLLKSLRARGLREIRGNLVLDRSYFERIDIDPAKFDAEPLRPYNVGPDSLLVNFKAVRFSFIPDPERGIVQVVAEPRLPQVELVHSIKLGQGGCGNFRSGLKVDVQGSVRSAKVSFTGAIPASCGERSWYLGVLSHPDYVFGIFKSLWEELGGTLTGGWRDGAVPGGARLLTVAESPPLTEVVRDINKFSNNVMARHLFLTLSAEQLKLPGSPERSARVIGSWIANQGLEMPELVLENGSMHCVQDAAPELRAMPEALARVMPLGKSFVDLVDIEHLARDYLDKVVDATESEGDPHEVNLFGVLSASAAACETSTGLVWSSQELVDPAADVFARTQIADFNDWSQLRFTYCDRMRAEMIQFAPLVTYREDSQTCVPAPFYAR